MSTNSFILKWVKVQNFRTFVDATLNPLESGITGIAGSNGAGKSSFVDAILFALFGARPRDTTIAQLRRKQSDPKKDITRVSVAFTHAGQTIEVIRQIKGGGNTVTASIFLDGKEQTVATGGTAEQWVTNRLGMNAQGFKTAVLVPQEELNDLVKATAAVRRERIEKLAGIEDMNQAVKKARDEENDLRKQVKFLPGSDELVVAAQIEVDTLARSVDEVDAHYNELVESLKSIDEEISTVETSYTKNNVTLSEIEALFNKVDAIRHVIELNESKLSNAQSRLADISKEFEGINISDKGNLSNKYEELNTESSDLNNKINRNEINLRQAQREVGTLTAGRNTAMTRLETMSKRVDVLRAQKAAYKASAEYLERLSTLNETVDKNIGNTGSSRNLIAELTESITILTSHAHKAECPTCHGDLPDPSTLINQFKARISSLRDDVTALEAETSKARSEITEINRTLKESSALDGEISRLEEDIRVISKDIAATEGNLKEAQKVADELGGYDSTADRDRMGSIENEKREIISLLGTITRAEQSLELKARLESEISSLQASIKSDNAAINELYAASAEYDSAEILAETVEMLEDKLNELRSDRNAQFSNVKNMESNRAGLFARYEAALKTLKKEQDLYKAKKTLLDTLELKASTSDLLDEYRKERIARIAPELSATATDMISQMTNGRFLEVVVSDDFATSVVDASGDEYSVSVLSGGERSIVALALRIAIGSLITGESAGLLWLDEVLPAQDSVRRDAILNVLRTLPIQQIVMINHTHEAEDVVDKVVNVVYKSTGSVIE
jgi:DNA repair protein SbcC/Rad50